VISATCRRELSSSLIFPARQDAEGNSRHSDRNISGMIINAELENMWKEEAMA